MPVFISFFIILLVAVVFSQLFTRMRIPWVVALIVGGIAIGPSGFDIFQPDNTIDFLAQVGLIFLMFMAGAESRFTEAKGMRKHIALTAFLIGVIPTIVGIGIGLFFGYEKITATLLGIIFMSSAIAILIPQFQAQKIISSDLGRVILNSAITIDAFSLILLSIFLQSVSGVLSLTSFLIYPLLFILLIALFWIIPRIRWIIFLEEYAEEQDLFEKELRFVILILIGFVVIFEIIGLHAIVAGFFAGLVLSRSIQSRLLKAKLHAIGYGFFIPVFFVVIGAGTNMTVFLEDFKALILAITIIIGLSISKFVSGFLAGRLSGFSGRESAFLGTAVIPQLSTALAVAFLGAGQGILDQNLLSSVIILTIVTSIIAPILINLLGKNLTTQKETILDSSQDKDSLPKNQKAIS